MRIHFAATDTQVGKVIKMMGHQYQLMSYYNLKSKRDPAAVLHEVVGDDHGNETGFGISPWVGDDERDYVVIDTEAQQVTIEGSQEEADGTNPVVHTWSFDAFVKADLSAIEL